MTQVQSCYQVGELELDLIIFPTYKIFPDLDIGEIEIDIYYGDVEDDEFFNDDLILVI